MISDKIAAQLEARGLDIEVADRMGLASTVRDGGDCLVIPFKRAGEVVRRKYRTLGETKAFSADKGGLRVCWNEDVLRDDSLLDQPLIITEGELDALTAVQVGFARTISVPDGAPSPKADVAADALAGARQYDWLAEIKPYLHRDRVKEVVLATDGDAPGAQLMHELSLLLGRFRCKFLTYPKTKRTDLGRERLKDLNEVLQEYGAKGVVETVSRAQWLKVNGVYRMEELPPLPPQTIYEPPFDLFSANFKVRLGDFVVITGTPGFGKTSFANDLYCRTALNNRLTIAWASFEQAPQRDHRRNLRSWFARRREIDMDEGEIQRADQWINRHHLFLIPDEDEDPTLEWLLDKMEVAVVRHGARIVVIDPWNELEHCRRPEETETEYIGRAIRALKRFGKAFQVHVAVIAHPTKSTKDADGNYKMPTLYDIAGSAHWYNKCDLGVIVHRQSEDDTLIKVQKSRYHEIIGVPGEVLMQFCKDDRRFVETERPR